MMRYVSDLTKDLPETSSFSQAFGFSEPPFKGARALLSKMVTFSEDPFDGRLVADFAVGESKTLRAGSFWTPTVNELRRNGTPSTTDVAQTVFVRVSHLAEDVTSLLLAPENAGAVFQVASQFNCLEMMTPEAKPEDGIGIYDSDPTQGPACARTCPAGTAFRNYLVTLNDDGSGETTRDVPTTPLQDTRGQTEARQINCFEGAAKHIEAALGTPWYTYRNGYVDAVSADLLAAANAAIASDEGLSERFKASLRVGIQRDTSVVSESGDPLHVVTQVYASALPIWYSNVASNQAQWRSLAEAVLQGAYEATLLAGIRENERRTFMGRGAVPIFLTKLGTGAFDNDPAWAAAAIDEAIRRVARASSDDVTLDVRVVHYPEVDPAFAKAVKGKL